MRELLVPTGNKGKLAEIKLLLEGTPFIVLGLADVGITQEAEESGTTFEGNAIIKGMTYGILSGKLTMSEDSGLEIDALGGWPGVYTKPFADTTSDQGHSAIFEKMKDISDVERGAQMHSVIALFDPSTMKVRLCEGIARGVITREARGANGFGQDPLFKYDGSDKTGGEMNTEEKNSISHRAKSLAKAKEILLTEFV